MGRPRGRRARPANHPRRISGGSVLRCWVLSARGAKLPATRLVKGRRLRHGPTGQATRGALRNVASGNRQLPRLHDGMAQPLRHPPKARGHSALLHPHGPVITRPALRARRTRGPDPRRAPGRKARRRASGHSAPRSPRKACSACQIACRAEQVLSAAQNEEQQQPASRLGRARARGR